MVSVSQAQCQEVRKRKELELQILTEAIRSWEGDDITTLGSVVYMSQVMVQCAGSEVHRARALWRGVPLCSVGGNRTELEGQGGCWTAGGPVLVSKLFFLKTMEKVLGKDGLEN